MAGGTASKDDLVRDLTRRIDQLLAAAELEFAHGPESWFKYSKTNQGPMPYVSVQLEHNGTISSRLSFLVDTGSCRSLAPAVYAPLSFNLAGVAEQDTGLLAANGHPIVAKPLLVQIKLTGLPHLTENVWFGVGLKFGMLGNTSLLEQLGADFRNFPTATRGREFSLFVPAPRSLASSTPLRGRRS